MCITEKLLVSELAGCIPYAYGLVAIRAKQVCTKRIPSHRTNRMSFEENTMKNKVSDHSNQLNLGKALH